MPTIEFLNHDVVDEHDWSVEDDNLFTKAEQHDLSEEDYGEFEADTDESILEAAEDSGYDWPYGCRSGFCASCASVLVSGEIDMPGQQILSEDQIENDARVTCIGTPGTETVKLVYNAQDQI